MAYFACSRDRATRTRLIARGIDKPEWREVITLTACLLSNADDFVIDILKWMVELKIHQELTNFLIHELTLINRVLSQARKESAAIFAEDDHYENRPTIERVNLRVIEGGKGVLTTETVLKILQDWRRVTYEKFRQNLFGVDFGLRLIDSVHDVIYRAAHEHKVFYNEEFFEYYSKVQSKLLVSFGFDGGGPDEPSVSTILDSLRKAVSLEAIHKATNGRDIYITHSNMDLFRLRVVKIVNEWDYSITLDDGKKKEWREFIFDLFKQNLSQAAEMELRIAADMNRRSEGGLRIFLAGEALAEILASPVLLTPRVRRAAADALMRIIYLGPEPPDKPEPIAKDVRRA